MELGLSFGPPVIAFAKARSPLRRQSLSLWSDGDTSWGLFGWFKSRLISTDLIVSCEKNKSKQIEISQKKRSKQGSFSNTLYRYNSVFLHDKQRNMLHEFDVSSYSKKSIKRYLNFILDIKWEKVGAILCSEFGTRPSGSGHAWFFYVMEKYILPERHISTGR